MAKRFLKDILPNDKLPDRKMRDIRTGEGPQDSFLFKPDSPKVQRPMPLRPELRPEGETVYYTEDSEKSFPEPAKHFEYEPPRKAGHPAMWFMAFLAVLALLGAFTYLFSSATVLIYPKMEPVKVKTSVFAGTSDCACEKDVAFLPVKTEKVFEKIIPADSEKQVERKASGSIVIYNNYSSADQRLIKNTRFEAPNGLVYRIDSSTVVPGVTTKDGKKTPGSVEVKVYADFAGAEYNIGYVDFTIPGFKTDPGRYAGFYARSKTEMTGGFIGKVKAVSDAKLESAKTELRAEARSGIKEALMASVGGLADGTARFLPVELTGFYADEPEVADTSSDNNVTIRQKARGIGFALDEKTLDERILNSLHLGELAEEKDPSIKDKENIAFSFGQTALDYDKALSTKELKLDLEGDATLVFGVDADKFASDIRGKMKSSVAKIVEAEYPDVVSVDMNIKPFWNLFMPSKLDKINTRVILEQVEEK